MRRESAYLRDALRAIDELTDFVRTNTKEQFLASPLEQSYVLHRLVIFGEAVNRLAGSFQQEHPVLPWPQVMHCAIAWSTPISIWTWNSCGESPVVVWRKSGVS
jgi:uncharacterized protein with HEPN domain